MEQFIPGQIVYLSNGQEAEYISSCSAGGHVVSPIFTRHYSDIGDIEETGEPKIVSNVYSNPATEKLADSMQALQKKRDELHSQIRKLNEEIEQKNIENKNLTEAINKYPDIKKAVDFLEGKITHLVFIKEWGASMIYTFKEALEETEYGFEGLRLISLFGTNKRGHTQWKINRYRDGSGNWQIIYPFYSEQQAKEFLQEVLNENIQHVLQKREEILDNKVDINLTIGKNCWLDIPREWIAYKFSLDLKSKMDKIKKQKEALEKEESEVLKIRCSLDELTTPNPSLIKTELEFKC
jgi:DNA-binding transcriptional MerR regulator